MKKQMVVNTVLGMAEPLFRELWVSRLWLAMAAKAKGYRMHTLKNRPPVGAAKWRGERRKDKVGTTKLSRRLMKVAVQA